MTQDQAPHSDLEAMRHNISQLEKALVEKMPEMPMMLRRIHTDLKQCPELLHLLDEEEVAKVVRALSIQTGVVIQAQTAKSHAKSENAKLKNLSLDDI